MDYLTIEANEGGEDVHILVITDHFTRYAQAIVTNLQMAKCTAQNLWDKFIVQYWLPEKILMDQGHNFESDLLKALCEIVQVKKIRTSGYHPQTNGQCEHFNVTLINMLGTLPDKPKKYMEGTSSYTSTCLQLYQEYCHWFQSILPHVWDSRNHICQLIYSLGQTHADLKGNSITYIENLKNKIEWAYQTANEAIKKEHERNKQRYDCMVRCAKLMIGEKVLLRCTAFKGKHKNSGLMGKHYI